MKVKETTAKEWKENPAPRKMWVWDEPYSLHQGIVTCVFDEEQVERLGSIFPVIAVGSSYKHCAELSEIEIE